ncbi:MAG: UbiA family prenyltransferase, partial [Lentisphaerae bacterium]|nr:UbiA family prenyltransferase [Lentisphaerota bacterium]
MKRLIPWAQFFRLPNLPTAPGDAVAGAAICMAVSLENAKPGATGIAIGAGLAALFLYMFGLADNDISGYKSDITYAPHRPLVAGSITLSHALLARLACLLFVAAIGFICGMPIEWWSVVFLFFISITLYNRLKDKYR